MSEFKDPFSESSVGIVCGSLMIQGGAEEIVRALAVDFNAPVYTLSYDPQRFDKQFNADMGHRIRKVAKDNEDEDLDDEVNTDQFFAQSPIPAVLIEDLEKVDVEKFSTDALVATDMHGTILAEMTGLPYVTYMHHAGKMWNDYFWEMFDNTEGLREKFSFLRERWGNARRMKRATKKAEHIVTNSERTKHHTNETWNVSRGRMNVVYPAIDTGLFTPGEPERDVLELDSYFLAPQRLEAYKNVHVLVEAAKMAEEHLVIVGTGTLEDYARREAQYSPYVHTLGYVEEETLRDLYRGAKATLQGTMREDFGMVPVESMACGTPCLLPASGGFLESVGEGFEADPKPPIETERGKLFDPKGFDHYQLAGDLQKFDSEEYDPDAISEHAQQFARERFIEQMTKIVERHLL
ncbi:glycosyltransferase [Halorussus halophilus]|uniref:glycosyltransferase n=1 Tax=Halorussus halophilus TaxID=2650975 RepID=UPI00130157BC|nr:glycosyltransferase [Halorussus halophilus]